MKVGGASLSMLVLVALSALAANSCRKSKVEEPRTATFRHDWDSGAARMRLSAHDTGLPGILNDELLAIDRSPAARLTEDYIYNHANHATKIVRIASRFHGSSETPDFETDTGDVGSKKPAPKDFDVFWLLCDSANTLRLVYPRDSSMKDVVDTTFHFSSGFMDEILTGSYESYESFGTVPFVTTVVSAWDSTTSRQALVVGLRASCSELGTVARSSDQDFAGPACIVQAVCLRRSYGRK